MTSIPLVLPIEANEAAALAELVYVQLEGKELSTDLRNRFAGRLPALGLKSFTAFPGSVARDPIHHSTYYVAIDALGGAPMLLRIALASSPASGLFPGAMLIGRMRTQSGQEVVVNAVPFGPSDSGNVRMFAREVDRAFLPRPIGAQTVVAVEGDAALAFQVFRGILRSTGLNVAAVVEDYDAALWAAIRAGWREGWSAETCCIDEEAAELYTGFRVAVSPEDLEHAEGIYNRIAAIKAKLDSWKHFDFEIVLDIAHNRQMPGDLSFCLDWLKSRGCAAQFAAVRPDRDLRAFADVARQFGAVLSFSDVTEEARLEEIGRATGGKFHVTVSALRARDAASSLFGRSI